MSTIFAKNDIKKIPYVFLELFICKIEKTFDFCSRFKIGRQTFPTAEHFVSASVAVNQLHNRHFVF